MVLCWLSVDPLAEKYPHQSPYVFTDNNPINKIDPDGREAIKPPSKGSSEFNSFVKDIVNTNKGHTVNWSDKDGSWSYNAKSQSWIGIGESKGNNISFNSTSSVQEANVGVSLSLKVGGLSVSFGPEIAVGNASNGLNVAGRANGTLSFDARKFLSIDAWSQSKVDLKVAGGIKISDQPTLVSGFKTSTSVFEKVDVNLFGSGGEFKMSQPFSGSNTSSYSLGLKVGASASAGLNQTVGTEVKATGTALATDRNDGGY